MSFRDNEKVRQCIESLAELLSPRPTSSVDVDRIIRYLRPASNSSTEHARVIKESIRRGILTHPSSGSDALIVQDKFDKECLQLDYRLLNSFLSLLKPLSHHVESYRNTTISSYNENSTKSDDFYRSTSNTITNKAAQFLPKTKASGSYSASIQYTPPTIADTSSIRRDEGDYSEYSALVETGSMWTTPTVELRLITDLIYIFQGVGGKHIKYDPRSESYVVDPALRLNSTVRDTTLCLCELGWLYGRVMEYVARISVVSTGVNSSTSTSSGENRGLVVQAFGFSLQEELHDYYRLLAVLEQEAKRTLISLNSEGGDVNPFDRDHPSRNRPPLRQGCADRGVEMEIDDQTGGTSGLTLLRLKAWMQEPIERMCLLARLVDSAGPLTGGALASRLHFFSRHGDVGANMLIQRVMYSVCVPLYSLLTRWLLHGELNDPHEEFFVGMQHSSQSSGGSGAVGTSGHSLFAPIRNVWKDTYFLRPPMLPTFLSSLLAHKILVIGKSINFIKLCIQRLPKKEAVDGARDRAEGAARKNKRRSLREVNRSKKLTTGGRVAEDSLEAVDEGGSDQDDESAVDAPVSSALAMTTGGRLPSRAHDILSDITTPEVEAALLALRYGKEAHLSELVSSLSPSIDMRLLSLMRSRFHVEAHFSALKKFMLLGQGDFVTCLMDGVGPELKKRATQLFRHNLTGILEGAIRSSNAQYEPSYITDRIGVRLLEAAPGDSGWEIFSLDYSIDSPLNAVVHSEAMARYRIAFHMLWRLKRVEWSLAIAWKQLTSFSHVNRLEISRPLKVVLHKCTLHRARMMHVVTNLAAFLMFEVMESAWVTLGERVRGASCLDEVVDAHDAYLSEVLDKALLAPHHEQLNVLVQALLQSILRFCSLEDVLIADASASINARRVQLQIAEDRSRRGEWGEEDTPSDYTPSGGGAGGKYDGVPVQVIQRLEDEVSTYNNMFDALMTKLREQGEVTGEILRFLTFRLDFNDYHTLQQQSHGDGSSHSPGRTTGVSPMTHQIVGATAGGRGGSAFPFNSGDTTGGGRGQKVAIQLDQDYSPTR